MENTEKVQQWVSETSPSACNIISRQFKQTMNNYHNLITNAGVGIKVLVTAILLFQAKTFVQTSLILRCGDIETNPGPYQGNRYVSIFGDNYYIICLKHLYVPMPCAFI